LPPRRRAAAARGRATRALAPPLEEGVQDHQARADRERHVGDVERREIGSAPMRVDEIDHEPVLDAVDDVADRTRQDQREREREPPLRSLIHAAQPPEQHDAHAEREHDEEPALPTARPCEEGKRSARIVQTDDVEHRQHRCRLAELVVRLDPALAELVGDDDEQDERQPTPTAATEGWSHRGHA